MNKEEILNELLQYFIDENKDVHIKTIPSDYMDKRNLIMFIKGSQYWLPFSIRYC